MNQFLVKHYVQCMKRATFTTSNKNKHDIAFIVTDGILLWSMAVIIIGFLLRSSTELKTNHLNSIGTKIISTIFVRLIILCLIFYLFSCLCCVCIPQCNAPKIHKDQNHPTVMILSVVAMVGFCMAIVGIYCCFHYNFTVNDVEIAVIGIGFLMFMFAPFFTSEILMKQTDFCMSVKDMLKIL